MEKKKNNPSGIVLLAKQYGKTSFNSLYTVKKALNTTKVGHTGTLDSFAEGLLVVCVGALTRISGSITAFNKDYEAVIAFGNETDTLDPCGTVIKTSRLPTLSELEKSFAKFTGTMMQVPPAFSALQIDGKRSSDLVRGGKTVELPARPVTVYKSELKDVVYDDEKLKTVKYAKAAFSVSKGTYIRALARDIAADCGSAAHLVGLRRTKVGNFDLRDACGYSLLEEFQIENVLKKAADTEKPLPCDEKLLYDEIRAKTQKMTTELAEQCGFFVLVLKPEYQKKFFTGYPLNQDYFSKSVYSADAGQRIAVFSEKEDFCGMIHTENNRILYDYVIAEGRN